MYDDDKLMTLPEIAAGLDYSIDRTRKFCREGLIPAFKINGRDYRITRERYRAFINEMQAQAEKVS